jgi:hypothetical protein
MKATIASHGTLIVWPETELEEYALRQWKEKNTWSEDEPDLFVDLEMGKPKQEANPND